MTVLALAALCATAAVIAVVLLLRRYYVVISVSGSSMTPGLRPGDRVLLWRSGAGRLQTGAVVVLRPRLDAALRDHLPGGFEDAGPRWAIKRVAALPGDAVPESVRRAVAGAATVPGGMLVVLADNPAGADSRRWGFVPVEHVLGHVVARLSPRSRQPGGPAMDSGVRRGNGAGEKRERRC